MRTENDDQESGIGSELIKRLFECAERLGQACAAAPRPAGELIAVWWAREAHLAVERGATAVEAGVPFDTAWFLAVDDPGFQLAKAHADEYYTA